MAHTQSRLYASAFTGMYTICSATPTVYSTKGLLFVINSIIITHNHIYYNYKLFTAINSNVLLNSIAFNSQYQCYFHCFLRT